LPELSWGTGLEDNWERVEVPGDSFIWPIGAKRYFSKQKWLPLRAATSHSL